MRLPFFNKIKLFEIVFGQIYDGTSDLQSILFARKCKPSFPLKVILSSVLLPCFLVIAGCNISSQRKEDRPQNGSLQDLLKVPVVPKLVREASVAQGLNFVSVEGVTAVNRLPGTGGDLPPSVLRDELIAEMKKHDIPDPEMFLQLPGTAIVRVQAIIPPGAKRGDYIDLRVISPPQTEASDLHGGWLMDTRLRQQQTIAGEIRKGDVQVIGTGTITTRGCLESQDDETLMLQGLVLGGGRIQNDRKLGLVIRPEYQHVKVASKIAEIINRRFFFYEGKNRGGVALAKEDDYIEISVHPRYRRNVHRLMAVIGMVSTTGENENTQAALIDLGKRLLEPTAASEAALQLEAIGDASIPTLLSAISNPDPEVRFFAAEALAYLDRNESIKVLEDLISEYALYRHEGLLALEAMDCQAALEALSRLMQQPSIETRYGAFRAIRRRPDGGSLLRPVEISEGVNFYSVASEGPPFIALSLVEKQEIVLFGSDLPIPISGFVRGLGGIVLKGESGSSSSIRISRFRPGMADRRVIVDANIGGLVSGVGKIGGDYGDCISLLRSAKEKGFISCDLAIDPLPKPPNSIQGNKGVGSIETERLPPVNLDPKNDAPLEAGWWGWLKS